VSLPDEFKRFPKHWDVLPFTDVISDATSGNLKIQKGDYLDEGEIPVVDQGQALFGGYTDNSDAVCKAELPTIIFGDHTRLFKFIEQPFALGADGAKVLEPVEKLDKKFLFHYLNQLRITSAGYSRHYKFLKETYVPIPPLPEQKRIAAILDKADAIRRKRQQAIQLADEFLRSVFLEMFGDPVANPKRWDVRPLIELIDPDRPITYGILKPGDDVEGGVPYIRVVDMKDGVVLTDQVRRTTREIARQYKRSMLRSGDVLLSIRGHVGRLAVVPEVLDGANITQDTARLASNQLCRPLYLYACLDTRSMQFEMQRYVKGAAVKGINLMDVKQLAIPVPPIAMQEKIEGKIRVMTEIIRKFEVSNTGLSAEFNSLVQNAFNGNM